MHKKKLKNCKCIEIKCCDCPLSKTPTHCSAITDYSYTTFGQRYETLKKVVDLLEKDIEKEVEVNE